jgi:hypothetical protein
MSSRLKIDFEQIRTWFSELEIHATDGIAAITPWFTPIPSAVLVANAAMRHLSWSAILGTVAALIIEGLGITTVSTALMLWDYNAGRRKSDPPAPFMMAAALVGVYLFSTIALTILLEIIPVLSLYAPGMFPLLALVGALNLALRNAHRRRLMSIAHEKTERRQAKARQVSGMVSDYVKVDRSIDRLQPARQARKAARMEALLAVFEQTPGQSIAEAARQAGVSRQTAYEYLAEWERAGRTRRSSEGVEVLRPRAEEERHA